MKDDIECLKIKRNLLMTENAQIEFLLKEGKKKKKTSPAKKPAAKKPAAKKPAAKKTSPAKKPAAKKPAAKRKSKL